MNSFEISYNLSITNLILITVLVAALFWRIKLAFTILICRLIGTTLLILCLLEPRYVSQLKENKKLPVLLDISDSMQTKEAQRVLDYIKNEGVASGIYPFASEVSTFSEDSFSFDTLKKSWGNKLATSKSAIISAINSVQEANNVNGIILISDGIENEGDNIKLNPRGVPVYPIAFSPHISDQDSNLKITGIIAPTLVAPDSMNTIIINLEGDVKDNSYPEVDILLNQKLAQRIKLTPETVKSRSLKIKLLSSKVGIDQIEAKLPNQSTREIAYSTVAIDKPVIVINSLSKVNPYLGPLLKQIGFEPFLTKSSGLKDVDLTDYGAVILDNIPARELEDENINKIQQAMKLKSVGLLTLGGDKSYGLGDYHNSEIEKLLPVNSLPPEPSSKRLNNAIVLVIDKSASMEQGGKLLYAKIAASEVIKNLNDKDYFSLVSFDAKAFMVIKLSQVSKVRDIASERINRLYPALSSNLIPALNMAQNQLESVSAGTKHIIILSDGEVRGSLDFYKQFATASKMTGITMSTVYVGNSQPFIMKSIAEYGGGKFYETPDSSQIPSIFIKDVRRSVGDRTAREQNFSIRRGTSKELELEQIFYPQLKGYVKTKLKVDAKLDLLTGDEASPDPLLAHFKYHNSTSAAWTSDLSGIWSNNLLKSSVASNILSKILNFIIPNESKKSLMDFDFKQTVSNSNLNLDLSVFEKLNDSQINFKLINPNGKVTQGIFDQEKEGKFSKKLPIELDGEFRLSFNHSEKKIPDLKFFISATNIKETNQHGLNLRFLEEVAKKTGGKINPDLKKISSNFKSNSSSYYDLRFIILAIFLLTLLVETYLRESFFRYSRTVR